jgi:diguanylate cyclase (GGDEF)-like protein/PAS domain S-box-containing protein
MNWLAVSYLLCSTFYTVFGTVALYKKDKNGAHWVFGFICLTLALWSMLLLLMSVAETAAMAALYRRLMIICWTLFFTELLYFVLFLSRLKFFYDSVWKNVRFLLPGLFCFLYYFFTPIEPEYMIRIGTGWAFANPVNRGIFWDSFFSIYYGLYCVLTLSVVLYWHFTTTHQREKRQSKIVFQAIFITLILGSFTDILLPAIGISELPPMTPVLCLICVAGMNFALTAYQKTTITPEGIVMDVFMMMSEGLIITDSEGRIVTMNLGAENILRFKSDELKGKRIYELFRDPVAIKSRTREDLKSTAVEMLNRQSQPVHVLLSCHSQYDDFGNRLGTVFTFQDINELKHTEAELSQSNRGLEVQVKKRTLELEKMNELLMHEISEKNKQEEKINRIIYQDNLTKLNNRRFFYEYLDQEIPYAERYSRSFSILFIDLDGFKLINDSLGHEMGDQLLIKVAHRLKQALRESDVICRAGGDEFLILLHNTYAENYVRQSCRKILSLLQEPIPMMNYNLRISASIGIAIYPTDGLTSEALIKNADVAMYEAKDRGKNRYVFYEEGLLEDIQENMSLTNDLYAAIENEEFELFYQPQVSATTHEITGFESLIRWQHPEHGYISPVKFIPLAERTGLIVPIGEWVIRTAMKQLKSFEKKSKRNLTMGVNLSFIQLKDENFVEHVKQAISDYGINPAHLEFEITETFMMEDPLSIVDQLNQLKNLGVNISIDDFGTEYSSLNHLKQLPLDRIKIPMNFVEGIGINEKDEAIIASIIVLAVKLGCTIVAEGVEREEQLDFLWKNSCQDVQGYYFYQPMKAQKIEHEFFSGRKPAPEPPAMASKF